jgi:hypothetical protein
VAEYGLTIGAIGFSDFIPISEEAFASIQDAKQLLLFGQAVEEKLDLVLENYADLERSVIEVALQFSIFPGQTRALLIDGMHLVNRRVANLLTTTRLYLDQVPHDISSTFGKKADLVTAFREATNQEYDAHLGYRVMEELRNFVQHRSLPTHNMGLSSTIDQRTTPPGIQCRAIPSVSIRALEDDPELKPAVLEELRGCADDKGRIDLVPHVRVYVESLGRIHLVVRRAVVPDLESADVVFSEHMALAVERFDGSLAGLEAVARDDSDKVVEREYLFDRITQRRIELVAKNTDLDRLSQRFASGSLA